MERLRKILRSSPLPICLISFLCFAALLALRSSGYLESLELSAYDFLIRFKPKAAPSASRILVITISEEDILGQGRWPLTDETLADALSMILKYGPRAIGLDIFRDIPVPPGSGKLNEILTNHANIICVTKFGNGGVPPPPVLQGTDQIGFNDVLVDPGGIIRRGLLFLDNGDKVFYAFSLLMALHYLSGEGVFAQADSENPDYLRLGSNTIAPLEPNDGSYINADTRGYQYLIDFRDSDNFYQTLSLSDLLAENVKPSDIKDKIVFIGVIAQSVKDFFYTPFSRDFQAEQQMAGVVLHARLAHQLIRSGLNESKPIKTMAESQEILSILILALVGGFAGFFNRSLFRFTVSILLGALCLVFISYWAYLSGWWLPFIPEVLTLFLSAGMTTAFVSTTEKRQRALLMNLFSKHVSKQVADALWERRDQFLHKGRPKPQKMTASVLFSDIKGFTTVSETLEPQVLIQWLNTYMEKMTDIIIQHGGIVDDYAGDGIKANFGVPFPRETTAEIRQDAVNAVKCAIAMGEATENINRQWEAQGLPRGGGTRIGIHTGPIVTGALGSSQRMKFTTIGDIVNIAARLESYDKSLAEKELWRVLIGETTYQHLNGEFNTQRVGEVDLKGKQRKITVYRVLPPEEINSKRFKEVTK